MTKDKAGELIRRYSSRRSNTSGIMVDVFLDGNRVGEYQRRYPDLYNTFQPFVQINADGECKVLALYSSHYTATRVMALPECKDLGGESPAGFGFCPTNFYVPYDPDRGITGAFGFVAGCIWGDDSSWKIQCLDLTNATAGTLIRDERFGYCALPSKDTPLREAIDLSSYKKDDPYGFINLTTTRTFRLRQGQWDDPFK